MAASPRRLPRDSLPWILLGVGALAGLCLLGPVLAGVIGTRVTSYDVPGTVVNACAVATLADAPHVGLSWRLPSNPKIEASAWVRTYPGMLCWKLPRLRILPDEGAFHYPAVYGHHEP